MSKETGYLVPITKINQPVNIKDFITLGSSINNNIIVTDSCPRHCRIAKENDHFMVRDLNSKLGTFVNGTRVQHAYLSAGDRLYIGSTIFIFSNSLNTESYKLFYRSKNIEWQKKLNQIPQLAKTDHPLLILGESGSGKEVIARQVHNLSNRSKMPFISINCSALSESLIESELFGHKKGSFTGAESDRKGAFLAAHGGTLFLDEIGDLPLSLQPKLLRAIENQEVKAVGSDKPKHVDVRIVTATHKRLDQQVQDKKFREDLFFRINTLQVNIPSLRQRREDIETLVYYFCKQYKIRLNFSAIKELEKQMWPGNIRELKNIIARASALYKYQEVNDEQIVSLLKNHSSHLNNYETSFIENSMPPLKQIERKLIIENLKIYKGNQKRTAEKLKIPASTLHDRIRSYQINVNEFRV